MSTKRTTCSFDGRCGPPVRGGRMWWSYSIDGKAVGQGECGPREQNTSNMAEYAGLLTLMRRLKERGVTNADIASRSEMIVKMVNSEWGKKKPHNKSPHLQPYLTECRKLLRDSGHRLEWVRSGHRRAGSKIERTVAPSPVTEPETEKKKGTCRNGGCHRFENSQREGARPIFRCSKCGDRASGWEKKKKKKKRKRKASK